LVWPTYWIPQESHWIKYIRFDELHVKFVWILNVWFVALLVTFESKHNVSVDCNLYQVLRLSDDPGVESTFYRQAETKSKGKWNFFNPELLNISAVCVIFELLFSI
jgi:hypothetical protein